MFEKILAFLTSLLNVTDKMVPDKEERMEKKGRKRLRLSQEEYLKIYTRLFNKFKADTAVPIASHVNFVNEEMEPEQRKELIANLELAIYAFRAKRPRRFREWLQGVEAQRLSDNSTFPPS